jgi:molecular chaperone DnaK (HSP70)
LIQVYEGEGQYVNDNYLIGRFTIENVPHKRRNEISIEVTFDLDEDSILTVTGLIKENNSFNKIIIKNDKGGLSENEKVKAKEIQKKEKLRKKRITDMDLERNYKNEIINII